MLLWAYWDVGNATPYTFSIASVITDHGSVIPNFVLWKIVDMVYLGAGSIGDLPVNNVVDLRLEVGERRSRGIPPI